VAEYSALRSQWIRGGEGFLILYSITQRSSFDEVEGFRRQIFQVKDVDASEAPPIGTTTIIAIMFAVSLC
jgi:GTPase SAR1 family protein